MSKYLYILDNGHGEETLKKSSPIWKDGLQLHEYEFNRNVVKFLGLMLKEAKIDYKILVPEESEIGLRTRCKRANEFKENSIFISVHANQYTLESVHGFETHYYKAGKEIATIFQKHIGTIGKNRGIKQSNFYVIKNTLMPAILTENGFYSNEKECRKLLTADFQYKIAEQHFNAIKEIESL